MLSLSRLEILLVIGTLLIAAAALIFQIWEGQPAVWVVLALALLAYPHTYIAYHGDAVD